MRDHRLILRAAHGDRVVALYDKLLQPMTFGTIDEVHG